MKIMPEANKFAHEENCMETNIWVQMDYGKWTPMKPMGLELELRPGAGNDLQQTPKIFEIN